MEIIQRRHNHASALQANKREEDVLIEPVNDDNAT